MGVKTFTHNSPSHSQELLDKLNALRGEGHFCDVTVRVQGQLFAAHKVVLACCSDFLRAKLSGKPGAEEEEEEDEGGAECGEEGKPVVLDLHHVTVAGFAPLLEYAYTATLSISTENIIDVLAAASYMQMFSVASTCSEFMKSSILWNSPGPAGGGGGAPARPGGHRAQDTALSPSPVSSECSVAERPSAGRGSRRKRKGFARPRPAPSSSPQAPNPSPSSSSFPESSAQALEPSLAFSWTYPFGVDRRFGPEKSKLPEGLLEPSPEPSGRALAEYLSCEGGAEEEEEEEEDVQVKVERLSDEEVHEEASQPVSASHSSLSDQQTVPGSERHHEDLLISPQSSSIGSMDEGVTEGLQSVQGTPHTSSHMEEDERLENVQYPYHLYITPSTRPGLNGPERPFQCPTCGVRFTRIQNLKQHMLIHSETKVCPSEIASDADPLPGSSGDNAEQSKRIFKRKWQVSERSGQMALTPKLKKTSSDVPDNKLIEENAWLGAENFRLVQSLESLKDLPVQVERLEKAIRDLQSLPMPTLGSASGLKQDSQPQSEAQDEVVLDPEFNVRISKTRLRLCSHTDHRRLTNDLFDTFFSKEWQATHSLRGTSGVRGNPPKEALDKRVVNAITSIKPFQCDHCGKKFTRAYSLKMHRLKHEGKHCFRCQICRATFSSFVECKHHMRVSRNIVRKPRIYECKTCGAMFTNSGNLIVHLRSLNHEASELANYSQTSEFLLPEYLIQMQEEALRHFEMTDHAFTGSSSSSVQTPVIAQASSTQNCEPHPSALQPQTPPAREGQGEDAAREGGLDEPKTSASITSPEELDEQEEEEEREEHTWREALVSIKIE